VFHQQPDLPPISPAVLGPGLADTVAHAIADDDIAFLRRQLERHLFQVFDLPGDQMYDRHGFLLHLGRVLGLPERALQGDFNLGDTLFDTLAKGPARRAAIVVAHSDRIMEADFRTALGLVESCHHAAGALQTLTPPTQLLLFLCGAPPSFPAMDPAAMRHAAAREAVKVLPDELGVREWSQPRSFDLGPAHRLTFSPFDWYYLSRGFRATAPAARWHCCERGDVLTFVSTATRNPCLEGVFARVKGGMQLVGIRYEADPAFFTLPPYSDDPFTLFRDLCSQLADWQCGNH